MSEFKESISDAKTSEQQKPTATTSESLLSSAQDAANGSIQAANEDAKSPTHSIYPELPKLDLGFTIAVTSSSTTPPTALADDPVTSYFAPDERSGSPKVNQLDSSSVKLSSDHKEDKPEHSEKLHHRTVTFAENVVQREIPPEDYEDEVDFDEMPTVQLTLDNNAQRKMKAHDSEEHFSDVSKRVPVMQVTESKESSLKIHEERVVSPVDFNVFSLISHVKNADEENAAKKKFRNGLI